jgi:uncharacterized protein
MLEDVVVVDGVLHGYHFDAANRTTDGARYAAAVSDMVYGFHTGFSPDGAPRISQAQMDNAHDAEFLASMMFRESHADLCIYHGLPMFGWFTDGGSPLPVGREMRDRWPGRVVLYGGISAHQPGALEEVDRLVEEDGVVALKLYPVDMVDGVIRHTRLDDPEVTFPLIERAQQLGVKIVAMHKAVPMGPVPLAPFRPDDVDEAAQTFPDMTFEVVHGGFAFLEETAFQVNRYPNVMVNLEGTSALLIKAPRKFARIIGTLAMLGGADRIIWGTGAPALHPRAFEEAMWALDMPKDMVEGEGMPPLTEEVKRGILGGNALRMLGMEAADLIAATGSDEFAEPRELAPQWSAVAAARS